METVLLFIAKHWKSILISTIAVALVVFIICTINSLKKYKTLYDRELQNVEAYQLDNSKLKGEVRQYKMTIDDLYASNDSLDQALLETMEKLKISNRKIKEMQYQSTQITKIDTVNCVDTIFVENTNIDTTFGDEWYKMRLQLKYPSTVITEPTFNSEQYVYIYNKKVYNKKPSKIFFIRWFQKKHTVTEVKVEEKNPYIKLLKQKFIKVEEND